MIKRKRRVSNWKFWNRGEMRSDWNVLYTIGKIFLRAIKYCLRFKKNLIWQRHECPKFWNNKSPNSDKKWHLHVVLMERHKVYYREGVVPPPKGYEPCKACVWNCFYYFYRTTFIYSTYINHLLFLVVQVDLILNPCLWIHPTPISKLQHALLPLKCCQLRSMPQFSSFFVVSL